jgi:preprotein translocase subunit SecG
VTVLILIHGLVCAFLVFVILLQPGKSDAGVGFGSSSQSIFGSRGAGNFLTKTTSICAILFLTTSFFLTRSRIQEYSSSVIKGDAAPEGAPQKPADSQPAKPAEPAEPAKKGSEPSK